MSLSIQKVELIHCKSEADYDQKEQYEWLSIKAHITFSNGKKIEFNVNADFFNLACFDTKTDKIAADVDSYCHPI